MADISALQAAVDKLRTTSDAVVAEVKSWDASAPSASVSQADIDALAASIESVESNLSSVSQPAAAGSAPGSPPAPAAAAPAVEARSEQVQPPWQASS